MSALRQHRPTKQLSFELKGLEKPNASFGGSLLNGNNPKTKRPLHSKLPIHVVLRANQGGMRRPQTLRPIQNILDRAAQRHGVKIYQAANVGNHIHLVIRISGRGSWIGFIRELTGRIAQIMKELNLAPKRKNFWTSRPFTRIVNGWRRAFRTACAYVQLNQLESHGWISRQETKTLKDLRKIFSTA